MNELKKSCNQCDQQMGGEIYVSDVLGFGNKCINYCCNAECPNFGLLQIPAEVITNKK